jgi:hypothetical protein
MTHNWTEQELWIVCICYKENLPIDLALRLTNTHSVKSMEMRYRNCLFLDKGRVEGSLSHASKTLVKVWNQVNERYPKKEEPIDYEPYIIGTLFIVSLILILGSIVNIALI